MREVIWTDDGGYRHRALVRDADADADADRGVQCDPPDISTLDWDGIRREIHNRLVDSQLVTWGDVQRQQTAVNGIVRAVVVRRIIMLYRQQEVNNE